MEFKKKNIWIIILDKGTIKSIFLKQAEDLNMNCYPTIPTAISLTAQQR